MSQIRLRQIGSIQELRDYVEANRTQNLVSWDIETTNLDPKEQDVVGHCLAFSSDEGVYCPVRHKVKPEQNLDPDIVWKIIQEVIAPPRILLVYNYKFEGRFLRQCGVNRRASYSILRDALVYAWLWNSNEKVEKVGLKSAIQWFHPELQMLDIREVPGAARDKKMRGEIDFSYTDPEQATLYAAADPVMTIKVYRATEEKVEAEQALICQVEHNLIESLLSMEESGVLMDRTILREADKTLERLICQVEKEVYEAAGGPFNLLSSKQLAKYFTENGIAFSKTEKGNPNLGEAELEILAEVSPIAAKIVLYRKLCKERSTYVGRLLESTTDDDPYAHFKFSSVGAPTGRLSSGGGSKGEFYTAMNVQSIPSASKYRLAKCRKIKVPPAELNHE